MRGERSKIFSLFVALSLAVSMIISSATCYADVEKPNKYQEITYNRPAYKEGELIVKFEDDMDSTKVKSFASQNGLKVKKSLDKLNIHVFDLKEGTSVKGAMKKLMNDENVEYVQPNYVYRATEINDTYYDNLWGLDNPATDMDIDAPEAWGITQGSDGIVVAVIDTGVDIDHPDLKYRIWTNEGEIPGDGIDNDGNGYPDDIHGWDFYNDDNTVFDYEDGDIHGTHVAGTIAATANSLGVVGVAPKVQIMPLKFLGYDGVGYTSDAIRAIEYAADMGIRISNNSWGGDATFDQALYDAITYAEDTSNMLFVAAAGNDNKNIDIEGNEAYPASFDNDNILSVAAVNNIGNKAAFSNYGEDSVDVFAPGEGIYSTKPTVLGGGATVFANVENEYKSFLSTFGLEDLSEDNAKELIGIMLKNSLGLESASSKILLVDDDDDTNTVCDDVYGSYYAALTANVFVNVSAVEIPTGSDSLSESCTLEDYDAVIWFTGKAYGSWDEASKQWLVTPLTGGDTDRLTNYLNTGGKLLLFGEDILDGIENSSFVKSFLKAEVSRSDYGIWDKNHGYANPSVESSGSILFNSAPYGLGDSLFRDHIEAVDGAEEVLSYTGNSDTYMYLNGTSMAAPHVSGIAALLLSKNPDLSYDDLKDTIMGTGEYLDGLDAYTYTNSMVNAFNALKSIAPEAPKNLTAKKEANNIVLDWYNVKASGFGHYEVERSIDGGIYTLIGNPTANTYTDPGFDSTKTYRYKVRAVYSYPNYSYSNISGYSNIVIGNVASSTDNSGGNNGSSSSSGGSSGGGGGGGGAAGPSTPSVLNPSIDSKVEAALKDTKTGTNIKIPIVKIDDTESAVMSTQTLENLGKSGKSISLVASSSEITITSSALMTEEIKKYINDNSAKLSINIKEIKGEEANLLINTAAAGLFKIGDRIFDFTAELKTSNNTINISEFAQELKLSIKLTAKEIAGIDANKLGVYYYNTDKKAWEYVGGVFDAQNSTITFDTDHFSKYAVMRTENSYNDIDKHWAKSEIELMAAKHIIEVPASKEFDPNENITRAEVVKMLVNMLRFNPDKSVSLVVPQTATFKDVKADDPYFAYVETAVKYGITTVGADGMFKPNDTITREQLTTMIIRTLGIETDSDMSVLSYGDKDKIPAWATKSIVAAYERGYVQSINGKDFGVGNTATRAQAAVIIKRVMEKSGLILVPEKLTGKLIISDIEGQHFELETKDGIYVLIHDLESKYLAKLLSNSVGKNIEVSGYEQGGYTIYQRGRVFKVISITVK